jgi:hypothetical protein
LWFFSDDQVLTQQIISALSGADDKPELGWQDQLNVSAAQKSGLSARGIDANPWLQESGPIVWALPAVPSSGQLSPTVCWRRSRRGTALRDPMDIGHHFHVRGGLLSGHG